MTHELAMHVQSYVYETLPKTLHAPFVVHEYKRVRITKPSFVGAVQELHYALEIILKGGKTKLYLTHSDDGFHLWKPTYRNNFTDVAHFLYTDYTNKYDLLYNITVRLISYFKLELKEIGDNYYC